MTTNIFPSRKTAILPVSLLLIIVLTPMHNLVKGNERSNIILIRTDDQDYRSMEAKLPNGEYVMKNVKQLIEQKGTKFTRSFVSFPLCCPSRATTLTGQYAHNHDVLDNHPPSGGYAKLNHNNTLPLWLQDAGYYTIHIGKYLNEYTIMLNPGGEYPPPPPGWNKWYTLLLANDIHSYYNYQIYDGETIMNVGSQPRNYQTDVLTQKTVSYLKQRPYGNRPFFLQLDYIAPHSQQVADGLPLPAPRHQGIMNGASLPTPPNFNEQDVSDKPQAVSSLPLLTNQDIAAMTEIYRRRMESLLAVDEGVKKIMETLQQTGQEENTILIFTSDNGYLLGEHRLKHVKHHPYEPLQVPLIIRGPGIPANQTVHRLVTNVDYAQTILEWADAVPGLPQEGRSLIPLLADPSTTQWRKDFLIENPLLYKYTGVRTQNPYNGREYQYVEYDYNDDNIVDERELYALTPDECSPAGDPYQLESQHNKPCYTNLINQFHERLSFLKNCTGEACR